MLLLTLENRNTMLRFVIPNSKKKVRYEDEKLLPPFHFIGHVRVLEVF
jgi:hypothetical protein